MGKAARAVHRSVWSRFSQGHAQQRSPWEGLGSSPSRADVTSYLQSMNMRIFNLAHSRCITCFAELSSKCVGCEACRVTWSCWACVGVASKKAAQKLATWNCPVCASSDRPIVGSPTAQGTGQGDRYNIRLLNIHTAYEKRLAPSWRRPCLRRGAIRRRTWTLVTSSPSSMPHGLACSRWRG